MRSQTVSALNIKNTDKYGYVKDLLTVAVNTKSNFYINCLQDHNFSNVYNLLVSTFLRHVDDVALVVKVGTKLMIVIGFYTRWRQNLPPSKRSIIYGDCQFQ